MNNVVSVLKFALPTVLGELGQTDSKDVLNPVLFLDGWNVNAPDPILTIALGNTGTLPSGSANFLLFQDSTTGSTTFTNTGSNSTKIDPPVC